MSLDLSWLFPSAQAKPNQDDIRRAIQNHDPIMTYPDGTFSPPGGVGTISPGGLLGGEAGLPVFNGGTQTISTPKPPDNFFGYSYGNLPTVPGWFYNQEAGAFQYADGNGHASATPGGAFLGAGDQTVQPPGASPNLGSVLNPIVNSPRVALSWIEELAIRALLVLVGIVLIAGGFFVAGSRAAGATTIPQLVRSQVRL